MMNPVSKTIRQAVCLTGLLMAGVPTGAVAQLYQSKPMATQSADGMARPPAVAPAAVVNDPNAPVDAAGNAVDDYLDDSFRMVSTDVGAGRFDVAVRRLMDSAKQQGRAKDVMAALQVRSMQVFRSNPKGDPIAAMRADPVFAEGMQVLAQLSSARSPDAYYVLAMLYRGGVWLPLDAQRSNAFMQAAAAGGVQAARAMLNLPAR